MMKKEKYHLEYIFENTSHRSIWRSVSSDIGLSEWFADKVVSNGKDFEFSWEGSNNEKAIQREIMPESRVVYQWIEDYENQTDCYFEFSIYSMELTGERVLEITDFATNDERMGAIELWDMLIGKLRSAIGKGN